MRGREFSVRSAQVLARDEESECSAYDCELVALAEELRVSLVTVDEKLLKSFRATTRPLGYGDRGLRQVRSAAAL